MSLGISRPILQLSKQKLCEFAHLVSDLAWMQIQVCMTLSLGFFISLMYG